MQGLVWLEVLHLRRSGTLTTLFQSPSSQKIRQGHQVKVSAESVHRRSTLQGLMVVGLIVEEISNVDAKCVKVTGAQNIGQGHWVKVPAESVHLGEALCKVW